MDLVSALTLLALAGPVSASPTPLPLEQLYRNDQMLPGASDPWSFINERAPEPCGDGVAFRAAIDAGDTWAYRATSSVVEVMVDGSTQIPGSSETFGFVSDVRCRGGGAFSFRGRGAIPGASIYGWAPGGAIELLQSQDIVVNGVEFGSLIEQRANQQGVAILAYLEPFYSGEGFFYRSLSGPTSFVTHDSLILPGQTQPPSSLSRPRAVGDGMVFKAITGFDGALYHWSPTKGVSPLIDASVPVPGASGTFHSIGFVTVMRRGIAFTTNTSLGRGIYLVDLDGNVEPFVVPGHQTADGETLVFVDEASGAGDLLAFKGVTAGSPPLHYAAYVRTPGGTIHRLLGILDTWDGGLVTAVGAAADEHSVALTVEVTTPTADYQYILRTRIAGATAPEIPTVAPVGLATLVALLLAVAMWRLARSPSRVR